MEKYHFTDIPPNQLPRTDGEVRVYKLSDDIISKYKKIKNDLYSTKKTLKSVSLKLISKQKQRP